jgi:hypothetical protein
VFVHVEPCGRCPDAHAFAADSRDRRAVLRSYDFDGHIVGGRVAEPGQSKILVRDLLDDPRVNHVQVRNVIAGCWNFSVRRAVRDVR